MQSIDELHSLEIEKSVIGSAIIDVQALNYMVNKLTQEDFYNNITNKLFQDITRLHENKTTIDIITLSDEVDYVDIAYISNLTNIVTTSNIKTYCDKLRSYTIKRQFYKASQDIQQMIFTGNFDTLTQFKDAVLSKVDIDIKVGNSQDLYQSKHIVIELAKQIEERQNNNDNYKLKYGLKWLDDKTGGLKAPQLTIIAARPSVGKTAVAIQAAINLSKRGNHVSFFNLEMGKTEVIERMACNINNINVSSLMNPLLMKDGDWDKLGKSINEISTYNLNIFDDIFYLEDIKSLSRELKSKGKLDVLIIDYLQLMELRTKHNNMNEKVSTLSRQLKMIAKELNVPVICLSQLSRKNDMDRREPRLSDLRDSGSIEQDADTVLLLHEPFKDEECKFEESNNSTLRIIIAKQRSGQRDIYSDFDYYKNVQRIYDRGF